VTARPQLSAVPAVERRFDVEYAPDGGPLVREDSVRPARIAELLSAGYAVACQPAREDDHHG
jgi:hypothetical protein